MILPLLLLWQSSLGAPVLITGDAVRACRSLAGIDRADFAGPSTNLEPGAVFVGASRQCPSKLVEFRYLAKSNLRFDALGLERLTANFSDAVCSDDALKAAVAYDWTFRAVVMTPEGIEKTVYAQCVTGFERNRWGELLASIPADARDMVTREWLCLNWSRPLPQAEQRVAASARSKLRCDTVAADKEAMLKKYQRRSDVTRALDEVSRLRNPWRGARKRP